ncbi:MULTISPECIES: DUF1015 domain-containing protein [unclassified Modestobacter]|uniref:DUF1015 domain-containing protein n=1 Tax=unclassified Modestobacter TaxID=2643866 RepID=UPI0022AABCE0|nr:MULTISPECIES: DUF1015 domain-containing protein [unclassified Modestobacter]MCZ2825811.1 DUF1015 domain-containing protein [Modestobacter sp. VKM Ac-2981]MCZ2853124.1 DUF1015 domain-containing protein [Modestobacter sp. VKM Ac-2982]
MTGLDVRPFRALTYREHDADHLARVSSPAYDLVNPAGRDRLAAADPHNIVRLILPDVEPLPGPEVPRAERDRRSAAVAGETLQAWLGADVLVRDQVPALWRYEMTTPGTDPTVGWLGAVTLPAAGSVAVLPHEDTFPPAVAGRAALLAATDTDLEPIVLAHDPDPEVAALTRQTGELAPTLQVADPDGVVHRLWRVTDRALLDRLTRALAGTAAVIADGHHRFAAARDHQRGQAGHGSVLALVTPMGAGGLRVRAIHRVVPDLSMSTALDSAAAGFTIRDVPPSGGVRAVVADWLDTGADGTFLLTDGHRVAELSEPSPAMRAAVPVEAPTAWRRLDVVLAHAALLAGLWGRPDDPSSVLVAHDVEEALRMAEERGGVALLLRSPSPADVAAVARAGARMPRKSTLFVPKPRTGLVLRPHED